MLRCRAPFNSLKYDAFREKKKMALAERKTVRRVRKALIIDDSAPNHECISS